MKRSRKQRTDIQTLMAQGDVEALAEAARFQDVRRDHQGHVVDRGREIRREAVLALGQLGADAGNGAVVAALEDPLDSVRSAAIQVLHSRGEVTEIAKALNWLPAPGGTSRRLAVQAVVELRTTAAARVAVAALVRAPGTEALPDADIDLIHALAEPVGRQKPIRGVLAELLTALADERDAVADRAEELLVQLAPASTRAVIRAMEGGASPDRAASVLTRIGNTTAVQGLIVALERGDVDLRIQAAAALGWLCHLAAVEPLMQATRDPHSDVRAEASQALDRMGTVAVIVGISALLRPTLAEAVRSTCAPADRRQDAVPQLPASAGPPRFAEALEHARTGSRPAA
jgi:HEAT repeat protein